ncbi:MAG: YbaB/EbfC family nucleoid-associated protein [Patescibacteria group bacterium]
MLDKMKQLYQLQKQARDMQKVLRDTEIEAQGRRGWVTVVVNGELHVESVTINEAALVPDNKRDLERELEESFREALQKAQAIAAEKSKEMMKAMNIDLPGL